MARRFRRSTFLQRLMLGVGVAVFAAAAAYLTTHATPPSTPGSGSGAIATDASNNIAIGGGTPQSTVKLLVTGGDNTSSNFAFKAVSANGTVVLSGRDDGLVSIPGTLSATSQTGTISSANVSAGQFGQNTGGGTYSFPASVGIGTPTPSYPLDVTSATTGTSRIYLHPVTTTDYALLQFSNAGGTSYFGMDNSTGAGLGSGTAYALSMYAAGTVPITFSTNGTERMRILSSGNVGIGTAAPSYKLTVVNSGTLGEAIQTTNSTVGNPVVDLLDNGRGVETVISSTDGTTNGTYIASYSNHPLMFAAHAAGAQVTLTTAGNLGIGTGAPADRLQVYGGGAYIGDASSRLWIGPSTGTNYLESGNTAWNASANLAICGYNCTLISTLSLSATNVQLPSGANLYLQGGQTYGLLGQNAYIDTINTGSTNDPLEINYYRAGPTKICSTLNCATYSANFDTSGNVGIGGASTGDKLMVFGRTDILGTGNTSATYGLVVNNNANTFNNFWVRDDGLVFTRGGVNFNDGTTQTTAYLGGSQTINANNVSAGQFGLNTGSGTYTFPGAIGRSAYSAGYLLGGQNVVGPTDTKTNPIYVIGLTYAPTDTALSNMYGIGFSHSNFWGGGKSSGWGLYVASAGTIYDTISDGGIWTGGSLVTAGTATFGGVVNFPNNVWNISADGKSRLYFGTNGATYFGSQNGYNWRNSADGDMMTLSNGGSLAVSRAALGPGTDLGASLSVSGSAGAFIGDASSKLWVGPSGGANYIESGNNAFTAPANLYLCGFNCTQASYLTLQFDVTQVHGNLSLTGQLGQGLEGQYDPTKYRLIYAMSPSYQLAADGSTAGNLYGIAMTYEPGYGGAGNNAQAISGLSHQFLFMANGVTQTAIGSGIWTTGNISTGSGSVYIGGLGLINNSGRYIQERSTDNTAGGFMLLRNDGANWGYLYADGGGIGILNGGGGWAIRSNGSAGNYNSDVLFYTNNVLAADLTNTVLTTTGGITSGGTLTFSQANPTISSASYITIPGGAYFNSGRIYVEGPIEARGGITNDTNASLQINGGTGGYTYFPNGVFVGTGAINQAQSLGDNGGLRIGSNLGYNANLVMGGSSVWASGIRTYDNGYAEMRIWHANANGKIYIATGYNGDEATTLPSDGLIIASNHLGIGMVPSYQLQLSTDSAGKPNGGSWTNSSDARLKTDVTPVTGALSKINQLNPVLFDWRNPSLHGGKAASGGFLAQDVQKVFPDFVGQTACAEADCALVGGSNSKEYTLTLPFTFDAYMVGAVKELNAKVDAQQAEIDQLKAEIDSLKTTGVSAPSASPAESSSPHAENTSSASSSPLLLLQQLASSLLALITAPVQNLLAFAR